jgi:outer membrane receptor protein involved in Fe transport
LTKCLNPASALLYLALPLCITPPVSAWAQSPTEELVVTARKKEESLQEVPLSITAFSATQLQELGATNNYDVALLTPNFNTQAQLGRRLDRPTIRGQAAPSVGGEPNASYFIDGVFVSGSISSATLGPIERVEILRGPQSATFGRATFSGAVNYVTRQPTNEFEGETRVIGGSNETIQVSAWGSGPIVKDRVSFFLAAGLDKYGGEWRNNLKDNQAPPLAIAPTAPTHGDSSRLGDTESQEITGKLQFTPTDATTIDIKLGYTKASDGHYAQYILEPGELNCYLPTNGVFNDNGTPDDPADDPPDGTIDNRNEAWYSTSQGAYCGSFDIDKVNYNAVNPFSPANPLSDPASRVAGGPGVGDPRQSRFNLPDFYEGIVGFGGQPQVTTDPVTPGAERDQVRSLLQWTQDIGEWGLITRLAYNNDEFETAYDLDQTENRTLAGVFHFNEKLDVEDKSFELILDSPVDQRLRGSIGFYYFDAERNSRTHSTPGFNIVLQENGEYEFVGLAQYGEPLVTNIENRSVFGSLEYDVTDQLTFIAEGRYSNDQKAIDAPFTCYESTIPFPEPDVPDPDNPTVPNPYFGERTTDETKNYAFTPRFTLNYQATNEVMVYMLTAKGNKPAEFNTGYFRATADPCGTLEARDNPESSGGSLTHTKEEDAWTYEVGGKTIWYDGRILANISLFYIDWTNQATFQTVSTGAGVIANIQRNAGESEVYGMEIETSYGITDNLSASLSYGLANGKYKKYDDPFYANTTGIGLDENGKLINGSNNVAGHYIANNPKHSIIASLSYSRSINAELGWFARTDYILESKRYIDAANFMTIPNREVWNGRLGLDSEKWTLTTYVSNILDEQTPTAIPNFIYLSNPMTKWNKPDCSDCRTNVEAWAASPSRGRNYGLDVIFRF